MSISKMYTKRVSYKEAIDEMAVIYFEYPKLDLKIVALTLSKTMGLLYAHILEDLNEKINELKRVA